MLDVLGASLNEIGLVALLFVMVLLAAKVGKIGEAIGGFLAGSSPREHDEDGEDGEDTRKGTGKLGGA